MAAFALWIALIPKIHLYPCASSALDCGANQFLSLLKSVKVSRRHGVEERQRTGFYRRGDLMIIGKIGKAFIVEMGSGSK